MTTPLRYFIALLLCSINLLAVDQNIQDFEVVLEDGGKQDIIVLFEGPNRTPHDWATVQPGEWSIDLADLPPDRYTLTFYSDGYAEQFASITYKDGQFIVDSKHPDGKITLFKKRWVALEMVWNTKRGRELVGDDVIAERFAGSYMSGHKSLSLDYSFTQTTYSSGMLRSPRKSGPDLILRRHRYSGFFSIVYPEEDERFESAVLAPSNDRYKNDAVIRLVPGTWFYLRISGHRPESIAYAKVRVLYNGILPPTGVEYLKERDPNWQIAKKTAARLGIPLAE